MFILNDFDSEISPNVIDWVMQHIFHFTSFLLCRISAVSLLCSPSNLYILYSVIISIISHTALIFVWLKKSTISILFFCLFQLSKIDFLSFETHFFVTLIFLLLNTKADVAPLMRHCIQNKQIRKKVKKKPYHKKKIKINVLIVFDRQNYAAIRGSTEQKN